MEPFFSHAMEQGDSLPSYSFVTIGKGSETKVNVYFRQPKYSSSRKFYNPKSDHQKRAALGALRLESVGTAGSGFPDVGLPQAPPRPAPHSLRPLRALFRALRLRSAASRCSESGPSVCEREAATLSTLRRLSSPDSARLAPGPGPVAPQPAPDSQPPSPHPAKPTAAARRQRRPPSKMVRPGLPGRAREGPARSSREKRTADAGLEVHGRLCAPGPCALPGLCKLQGLCKPPSSGSSPGLRTPPPRPLQALDVSAPRALPPPPSGDSDGGLRAPRSSPPPGLRSPTVPPPPGS
ncbi:hypothetical protein ACRRTK_014486 [Alexandromys fortis]